MNLSLLICFIVRGCFTWNIIHIFFPYLVRPVNGLRVF